MTDTIVTETVTDSVISVETVEVSTVSVEVVESVVSESVVTETLGVETVDLITNEVISTESVTVEVVEIGMQGPRGPMGLPGEITVEVVAGETLSGHRAVQLIGNLAWYCDVDTIQHTGRAVGISTGAATAGQLVTIQCMGSITEPSWTFTEGPVYVGSQGQLTQSMTGLFVQQVGIATSSTTLNINPQLGIIRF